MGMIFTLFTINVSTGHVASLSETGVARFQSVVVGNCTVNRVHKSSWTQYTAFDSDCATLSLPTDEEKQSHNRASHDLNSPREKEFKP
ncbi:hypothetical protein H8959_021151 [Pygathrix nigripes]